MRGLDNKILRELEKNSRATNTEIAKKLGVSEGTVRNKIQGLVRDGIIKRFTIEESTKERFIAFTMIESKPNTDRAKIVPKISAIDGVKRVFDLAGRVDFLAEINTNSAEELNRILEKIRAIPRVRDTESMVVLSTN